MGREGRKVNRKRRVVYHLTGELAGFGTRDGASAFVLSLFCFAIGFLGEKGLLFLGGRAVWRDNLIISHLSHLWKLLACTYRNVVVVVLAFACVAWSTPSPPLYDQNVMKNITSHISPLPVLSELCVQETADLFSRVKTFLFSALGLNPVTGRYRTSLLLLYISKSDTMGESTTPTPVVTPTTSCPETPVLFYVPNRFTNQPTDRPTHPVSSFLSMAGPTINSFLSCLSPLHALVAVSKASAPCHPSILIKHPPPPPSPFLLVAPCSSWVSSLSCFLPFFLYTYATT